MLFRRLGTPGKPSPGSHLYFTVRNFNRLPCITGIYSSQRWEHRERKSPWTVQERIKTPGRQNSKRESRDTALARQIPDHVTVQNVKSLIAELELTLSRIDDK
jgi:hypothetical protein